MLRVAVLGDEALIETFLSRHATTSMFLRGNLAAHGLGRSDHRHATEYLLSFEGDIISAVFGLTRDGALMCQMPKRNLEAMGQIREIWADRTVTVASGDAEQVRSLLDGLGLSAGPWSKDENQPLYELELADIIRQQPAQLRRADVADRAFLADWFRAYTKDLGHVSHPELLDRELERRLEAVHPDSDLRIMVENGAPVGMTNLNARAADYVQLGGVYVPEHLRGRGFARRMVAAQLEEARNEGAHHAILFAASTIAAGVYESVGFRLVGEYRLSIAATPLTIGTSL